MEKSSAITLPPAAQLSGQLAAVREHLCNQFPEREQVVDVVLTALVAGEHCLLLGPPGTGKSALAREFARCIGGRYYEYLFSKFTTPEEFIGPFSISGLKEDRYERVLTGRLAEAEVAFLDEIFKSNSPSLNAMLPILNERLVFQGGGAQPIPLRVAVAASNELPTDPGLQALWDRLVMRCYVAPLQQESHRRAVMLGLHGGKGRRPVLDKATLDAVDVDSIPIEDAAVGAMLSMRRELESMGIVYGDRRWVKAVKCVRAYALVCGSSAADTTALSILSTMLWDKQEQMEEVAKLVGKVAAPHVLKAKEIFDTALAEVGDKAFEDRETENLVASLSKLATAHKRIKRRASEAPAGRERDEINGLAKQVASVHRRIRNLLKERYGDVEDVE